MYPCCLCLLTNNINQLKRDRDATLYIERVKTSGTARPNSNESYKHPSATGLLRTLHWLPVKAMIQYKIASLCFQCSYQNSLPSYISDLLHPYCPSRTLRSLDTSLLAVPRFSLETFGKRKIFLCFWTHCLELTTTIS